MEYKKPPITEAIIEIRFAEPLEKGLVDKVSTNLKKNYKNSEPYSEFGLHIDVSNQSTKFEQGEAGYRMSSDDRTDILIVTTNKFTVSRLAPYLGWEYLIERAYSNWSNWKRIIGYKKIWRVGVRYINRIDIPIEAGTSLKVEDYITVRPETSPALPAMSHYAMQLVMPLQKDHCKLLINTATIPSPLLNNASFVLDFDLSCEGAHVPQKDEDLWNLIEQIRKHKNDVFEDCITEKSRALFQ
jgi:uncharacterized protein (TIGR04255 family)